MTLISIE